MSRVQYKQNQIYIISDVKTLYFTVYMCTGDYIVLKNNRPVIPSYIFESDARLTPAAASFTRQTIIITLPVT